MREGCVHKEGLQSGGKPEDAEAIIQLRAELGDVHVHTPHLFKTGCVSSLNVKRPYYVLEVKRIYNCLLDYVPSWSCKKYWF